MAQTKVKLIADGVIVQGNLHASHGITTADIGENAGYLYYTDARVSNYLSTNGYDTATNIIASITDSAPSTLDTLNELAAALGDDANFSTTVTNSIATKLPLAGGTLTGNLNAKNILFSTSALPAANNPGINLRDTNNEFYFQSGSAHVFNFIRYDNRNSMMNLESTGISVTGGGTFSGNISGVRGFFNSGATNVVATFTSTDGTATLQCADPTGNVEFGASGDNFVVQPAGGVAQLTVGAGSSVFAEQLGIGTSPGSNMLYVKGTTNGTDITTRFAPFSNNSSSTFFLSSVSSGDGGYFYNSNNNTSGLFSYGDYTFYVGTGNLSGNGPANPRMVIKQDGLVGIGTTSPSSKLQVSGDAYVTGQFGQGVTIANKLATYGAEFRSDGASAQIFFGRDGNNVGTGGIGADATYVMRVWKSDFSQPFVIEQGGSVGIGTTSPTFKTHIRGGSGTEETVLKIDKSSAADSGGHTTIIGLGCESAGWAKAGIAFERTGAYDTGKMHFLMYPTGLNTGSVGLGNSAMTINNDGNVGIGTADPDHKLEVVGGLALRNSNSRLYFGTNNGTDRRALEGNTSGSLLQVGEGYTDIALQGNVGINTTSPAAKLDVAGDITIQNGLYTYKTQGYTAGSSAINVDITVGNEGGAGNVFKIEAGFAHYYGMSYNSIGEWWCTSRGTNVINTYILNAGTTFGGAWSSSKPNTTTLRVTKSAGTYAGGGKWWIKVTYVPF